MLLAGCGGDAAERRPTAAPTIQEPVARRLASRSDEVARLLEAGDSCGALAASNRLRDDLTQAMNRRLIPVRYRPELSEAVKEIRGQIACRPPQPPSSSPPPHEDKGKKKGKKHENKHRSGHGDEE